LSFYLSVPHVIATMSGSSALFVGLKCLGIGRGDEVLVPSLTFSATANAVCHTGAIPHFIDSCEETLAIDLDKLENYLEEISEVSDGGYLLNKKTKNVIRAIIPVYILGSAFDLKRLKQVSSKYHLRILEDSAEALGSNYESRKVSALSGLGVLSFNGNKILTTGGGGAVLVRDEGLAQQIRHLSTTAKKKHTFEFDHDAIG